LSKYDASEVETEMKLLDNIQAALNEFGVLRNKMMNDLQTGLISREEFVSSFSKGGEAHDLADNVESAIEELIDYNIDYAANQISKNKNRRTTQLD